MCRGGLAMGMGPPGRGMREEGRAGSTDMQIQMMEQQLATMQRLLNERLRSDRGGSPRRRHRCVCDSVTCRCALQATRPAVLHAAPAEQVPERQS